MCGDPRITSTFFFCNAVIFVCVWSIGENLKLRYLNIQVIYGLVSNACSEPDFWKSGKSEDVEKVIDIKPPSITQSLLWSSSVISG